MRETPCCRGQSCGHRYKPRGSDESLVLSRKRTVPTADGSPTLHIHGGDEPGGNVMCNRREFISPPPHWQHLAIDRRGRWSRLRRLAGKGTWRPGFTQHAGESAAGGWDPSAEHPAWRRRHRYGASPHRMLTSVDIDDLDWIFVNRNAAGASSGSPYPQRARWVPEFRGLALTPSLLSSPSRQYISIGGGHPSLFDQVADDPCRAAKLVGFFP